MSFKKALLVVIFAALSYSHTGCMDSPRLHPQLEKSLFRAIEMKDLDWIKDEMFYLDVNSAYSSGQPVIHHVVGSSSTEIVKYFVDRNVNLEIRDNNGATPLMLAVLNGNHQIVEALLIAKADPNARDKDGCTPFMYAAPFGFDDISIIDLLMRYGADPKAKNKKGQSVANYFFMAGRIVELRHLAKKSKIKIDATELAPEGKVMLPCMPCKIDFLSENTLAYAMEQLGFLAKDNAEFKRKEICGKTLKRIVGTTRPHLLTLTNDQRFRHLFNPIQLDQRVLEWYDQVFLTAEEKQGSKKSFLCSKLYHQIPPQVLECIIRYGAEGELKQEKGPSHTSWRVEGAMQFKKAKDNPWNQTISEQRGTYHCTQGDDDIIYHVGFEVNKALRTLSDHKAEANKKRLSFEDKVNNTKHILFIPRELIDNPYPKMFTL